MTAHRVALVGVLLAWASVDPSPRTWGPCDELATDEPLSIDRQRVGPYSASSSFATLRQLCPNAVPTLGHGPEGLWPALDLSIGELTILPGQLSRYEYYGNPRAPDPEIDWDRPPSHWVVRGCGARLPAGVPSCATWDEVVAAYGLDGDGDAQFGPVTVWLSALPGFRFELDVTYQVVGDIEVHHDLGRIPLGARIVETFIELPRRGAG